MAVTDELLQVMIKRMYGNAAHRNVKALVFAALGEGYAKCGSGFFGVAKEQLIKITHTVEQ